jgi:dTDP-4-dehydrorhamnose reductase
MGKLAITGGGGFVAGSVIQQAGSKWDVHALSGKDPLSSRPGLLWHTLDLKQSSALRAAFDAISPDVVIHAAAIPDIDFCEKNPSLARAVNVGMTANIADWCTRNGRRLIYLSSDNVFDGEKGNYVEDDRPAPINEYARTKAAGEGIVAGVADSVVARVALVMGFGLLGGGNSFLEKTVPMFQAGTPIYVPPEEIRTPIDVITLGRALVELAGSDFRGTLHLAGTEVLDRVTLTRRLAERLGYSPDTVIPRSPTQIPGRASRPRDVSLNTSKARSVLKTPLRDFDGSVDLIAKP